MKSIDFAIWLQALFEIKESSQINAKQTALIKLRLDEVLKNEKNPAPFCSWLQGIYDFNEPLSFNAQQSALIEAKVNAAVLEKVPQVKVQTPSFDPGTSFRC